MHVDRSSFGAQLAHWRVRHMHHAARKGFLIRHGGQIGKTCFDLATRLLLPQHDCATTETNDGLAPLASLSLAGQEHGRTIPLAADCIDKKKKERVELRPKNVWLACVDTRHKRQGR
jgi:hypothetical protein